MSKKELSQSSLKSCSNLSTENFGPGVADTKDAAAHQPSRTCSTFSSACWDITEQVLRTVVAGAQYAPTPYLGSLSVVALSIFEAVQGAKENQAVLGQLAKVACELVCSVHETYIQLHDFATPQSSFSSDSTLNAHVEELLNSALQTIDKWIQGVKSRKYIQKIIASRSDLLVIQEFRDQLKAAMDKFQLRSLITIRNSVANILSQQHQMEKDAADRHNSVRETLATIHEDLQKGSVFGGPITQSPKSTLLPPVSESPQSESPLRMKSNNPFATLVSQPGSIQGNISIQNINGNYTVNSNMDKSIRENFGNVFYGQNMPFIGKMGKGGDRNWDDEPNHDSPYCGRSKPFVLRQAHAFRRGHWRGSDVISWY
ncbi:hypothetical protein F5878DRAFT_664449 [Lentinula raphanica]|uniref:Uncharacterized protein n=1 Tax=Lentinula raphanica TaxID=153919 RepID=A0AA38U997_9AGAR|nr:hypothetical protein F5878DRAFT_664449 [Lentinula raphanica]